MKFLTFIIAFAPTYLLAQSTTWSASKDFVEENIRSISITSVMPAINTLYTLGDRETRFQTNATGGYNYAVSTKYFDLSFTTRNSADESDGVRVSEYSDIFFKTQLGDLEVTIHQAQFDGGNINEGPLTAEDLFFEDYQVRKQHFRTTYYLNTNFNKVLNNPRKAIEMRAKTQKNYFSSWLATVGYDNTQTTFPRLSENMAQEVFKMNASTFAQSDYIQQLDAQTSYLSLGYAGLHMLTTNFTYDFKLSFGSGLQQAQYSVRGQNVNDEGTSSYLEWDFGFNYIIKKNHNIGIRLETYQLSTTVGQTTINSNADQISTFYQYLF